MTATPPAAQREDYPGLVSRLFAITIDAVLITIIATAIGAGGPALWSSLAGSVPGWLQTGAGALAAVLPFVYFWLGWCVSGTTVGGLLLGIAVYRTDGSRVGVVRAALRALGGLLLAPVWLAGMLLTVADRRRRAAHDVVFRTVVRRVESG